MRGLLSRRTCSDMKVIKHKNVGVGTSANAMRSRASRLLGRAGEGRGGSASGKWLHGRLLYEGAYIMLGRPVARRGSCTRWNIYTFHAPTLFSLCKKQLDTAKDECIYTNGVSCNFGSRKKDIVSWQPRVDLFVLTILRDTK